MGIVVAAHHLQLDEKVALKFLLPEVVQNQEAMGRFQREARAAAKIKSEHVARVIDVGVLDSGSPYMVMEYLEGTDLARWLTERGPLPQEQAVGFLLEACEALAEAHVLGIIHRDLKPANLFLANRPSGQPCVKVLDFGISKLGGSLGDASLTKTSALMGSPYYMSPEQMASSKAVDARSDIWALGVVLYELLGGRPPFAGETLTALVAAVLQRPPEPLRNARPDLPPGLLAVVDRCLAKDAGARYSNVAELAAALAPYGPPRLAEISVERVSHVLGMGRPPSDSYSSLGAPSPPAGLPRGATTTSKPLVSDVHESMEPPAGVPSRGNRIGLIVGGVVVLLLLVGGVVAKVAMSSGSGSAPAAAAGLAPSTTPSASALAPTPAAAVLTKLEDLAPSASAAPASPASAPAAAHNLPPHAVGANVVPANAAPPKGGKVVPGAAVAVPPATPPKAAKANCDPPYSVGPDGTLKPKPECL
jgi:serine/threonine-protein kinase